VVILKTVCFRRIPEGRLPGGNTLSATLAILMLAVEGVLGEEGRGASHFVPLSSGEDRLKSGLNQDSSDFLTLVTLNLDAAILHSPSGAACLLHASGQGFFFGQADPHKMSDYGHRFPTATCLMADNVHATAFLFQRLGMLCVPWYDQSWIKWAARVHSTESNSTSKIKVAFGGMTPG